MVVDVGLTDLRFIKQSVTIVAENVKFLSAQQAPNQYFVEIVLQKMADRMPDQNADPHLSLQQKATMHVLTEITIEIMIHADQNQAHLGEVVKKEPCTARSVINAERIAKYLSNLHQEDQYSAVTALNRTARQEQHILN